MEATTRRVLRRKPLTDCSNVARKSDKIRCGGGGFPAEEVSKTAADVKVDEKRKLLKAVVEVNGGVGYGKENDGMKESAKGEESVGYGVDVEFESPLLSTPPVRKFKSMAASSSVSPMTIYCRRTASKNSYGSSSCPPVGKKRGESSDEDDQGISKRHTEPFKKKRSLPKDLISQDFIERQRAYFEEIDKFELPEEEEVSETE